MGEKMLRQIYGETLVELGKADERICTVDADLRKATFSVLFHEAFPERSYDVGIAEQNMAGWASGLAYCGKKPFINSLAMFSTGRIYDQIRQSICIPSLNVVIVGVHSGLSDYGDGATHQSVEDISLMRSLPNLTIFCPTDAVDTPQMVRAAAALEGPCFLRLPRAEMPRVLPDEYRFRADEPFVLRQGGDVVIFAFGSQVRESLEAADALSKEGIEARVVVVNTLKPVNDDKIVAAARGVRAMVTAEEHSIVGGLAAVVSFALRNEGKRIECVAIGDTFGQSAHSHEDLMRHYGLTAADIVQRARQAMAQGAMN